MRVIHFTASNGLFGAERAIIELAVAQAKAGQEVSVVSLNVGTGSSVFEKELGHYDVDYISLPFRKRISIRQLSMISNVLNDIDPDLVHCHNYKSNIYVSLSLINNRKIKKIATLHGYLLPKLFSYLRLYYFIDKTLLMNFDRIVLVSDKIKDKLPPRIMRSKKVYTIYNGISTEDFKSKVSSKNVINASEKESLKFICVGRLSPEKNYSEAIYLFSMIEKEISKSELLMVGDGPERERLEALANDLGLGSKVFFTGYVSDATTLIQQSDCLLITSLSEGLPMTLLEAMKSFTFVAYRDVGEIDHVLMKGELGYRLEKNLQVCAKDISTILLDSTNLMSIKAKAKERLDAQFSAEVMEKAYRELYESLSS